MRNMWRSRPGFTLVELVVVTPLIILLIGSVVIVTVQATTSALRSHGRTQLQYDTIAALDMIEQDVRLATRIGTNTSRLEMDSLATSSNPLDSGRMLVRLSDCQHVSSGLSLSDTTQYLRTYEVSGRNFVRNANFTGRWCGGGAGSGTQSTHGNSTWQRHGLAETLISDANLTFDLQYDTDTAAVTVTLTAERRVAGQDLSYTGRRYVESLNVAS